MVEWEKMEQENGAGQGNGNIYEGIAVFTVIDTLSFLTGQSRTRETLLFLVTECFQ